MPFPKYIITTEITENLNADLDSANIENEIDVNAVANQRMVKTLHHLMKLIKIAEDIFGAIEIEVRNVHDRTSKLNVKIKQCQETVDNINAKTAKVPIGSLTECQETYLVFKSYDVEKIHKVPIFSRFPRPSAVDKLRDLASGPSPPVVIPSEMVASEADGFVGTLTNSNRNSSSTHIHCKSEKIKDAVKPWNAETDNFNGDNKNKTSDGKVPSSVVAIDVSGEPFSRMASLRRSLIHVDFLIRKKKKKDKRRNTVAEADVKDLKDALQKIAREENLVTPNGLSSYQRIRPESKNEYNSKLQNELRENMFTERNNNSENTVKRHFHTNAKDTQITENGKSEKIPNNEEVKKDIKINEAECVLKNLSLVKRKPKSHIPISTVSAAMNVAVEMRQWNGIKKDMPYINAVCNGTDHDSTETDLKIQELKRHSNSSSNEDASQDESWTNYRKRLQDNCRSVSDGKAFHGNNTSMKESELSSSASSENLDHQDTNGGTTTECDSFFMSSDESDDDTSELAFFQDNYGSSTSVGSASDGSLNSLLSETGTEMTSSTGTLTSVGREQLLTPPPPPPMILSATVKDKDIVEKVSTDLNCTKNNMQTVRNKKSTKVESTEYKKTKHSKTKPLKSDIIEPKRNLAENSKSIFTSLVGLKTLSKDKNKCKSNEIDKKKLSKSSHEPAFDMYGNNTPIKVKQMPAFIKENVSPVIRKQEKSHMKSFFITDHSQTLNKHSDNESSNKSKTDLMLYRKNSNDNTQIHTAYTQTNETENMSSIPPKYEHQVTVIPVQRYAEGDSKNSFNNVSITTESQTHYKQENSLKQNNKLPENHLYVPPYQKPKPPVAVQPHGRSKSAARVVLDFDGKVIYTTNSLDRKHNSNPNVHNYAQSKPYNPYFTNTKNNDNSHFNKSTKNNLEQICSQYTISNSHDKTSYPVHNNISLNQAVDSSFNPCASNHTSNRYSMQNDPYTTTQPNEHNYHRSSISQPSQNLMTFAPKRYDIRPYSYAGPNSSDTYLYEISDKLVPDPNISGLPVKGMMLTRHNVNLHSKQMEIMNKSTADDRMNRNLTTFCEPPFYKRSIENLNKSPQSTMSTEDLFTVIHNCKKRMNIKTDSDVSLASSSRSSSPSYLRPTSAKGTLAETGFLSPRSQALLETSGDRRSWADFRPVDSSHYERKSLASDRLGPTKPTSMHDFKMLLLQARTSSQSPGQRKSAVELLKLPLNQNTRNSIPSPSMPLNISPRSPISLPNTPTSDIRIYNGHSTVPFKRGNRARTSLQSRYIMYPPIFEDCSEDYENNSDVISNKISTYSNNADSKSETDSP